MRAPKGTRWPRTLWIVRHGQSAGNVARDSAEAAGLPLIDIAERGAARRCNAVVALEGATTQIATPHESCRRHQGGHPGLATSGSGEVLAGLIAGLAARQAPLEQACAWGVVLPAQAGAALARRLGPLGFLARELAAEIPPPVSRVQQRPAGSRAA